MSPPPPTTLLCLSSLFSFSIFTAGNFQFIYLRSAFWAPRGQLCLFYIQTIPTGYLIKFTLKFMSQSYLAVIEGMPKDMGTLGIRLVGWWVILDSRQLSSWHPKNHTQWGLLLTGKPGIIGVSKAICSRKEQENGLSSCSFLNWKVKINSLYFIEI